MDTLDHDFIHKDIKEQVDYAGVGSRIGAFILDLLILSPITFGLNFYNMISIKSLPLALIIIMIGTLYKPLLEHYRAATFGKSIVGIAVSNYQFEQISLAQSFLRSIPFYASSLISIPMTIAMFDSAAFNKVDSFLNYSIFAAKFTEDFAIVKYLSYAVALFLICGLIYAMTNNTKSAFHDTIAKTYVIKQD